MPKPADKPHGNQLKILQHMDRHVRTQQQWSVSELQNELSIPLSSVYVAVDVLENNHHIVRHVGRQYRTRTYSLTEKGRKFLIGDSAAHG